MSRSIVERNANIDFLRILAMFLIILSHYGTHGVTSVSDLPVSFNMVLLQVTGVGGVGVAIFITITGYLLCEQEFKLSRIVNIELQVLFYSITIFAIFVLVGNHQLSFDNIVNAFFPTSTNLYWFITTYIVFSMFIPFVNKVIKTLSRKDLSLLIVSLTFIFTILPLTTFNKFDAYGNGGALVQFLIYYCFGAYIREYPKNLLAKNRFIVLGVVLFVLVTSVFACDLIGMSNHASYFYVRGSVFVVILAAVVVQIVVKFKPRESKFVSAVGMSTLGVYLIHDHPLVRDFIWKNLFDNSDFVNSPTFVLHMFVCSFAVFIICVVIDYLRNITFGRLSKSVSVF